MALHPQGLPDLRHSCLDLRRAHDAKPRHAAVLVLDERTRLDDSRLGQHRQAQGHLDLLPGIRQNRDAPLARRSGFGDQRIDHHRSQHIPGSPSPAHLPKHTDILAEIREKRELTPAVEEKLKGFMDKFAASFA